MANRWLNQFSKTLEKEVVKLYAHVTFGASGAPTLIAADSKGIVSVTRNSAGKYTFVFGTKAGMLDTYDKLLDVQHLNDTIGTSAAPTSPILYLTANSVSSPTSASLQIQFVNLSGAATDPANLEGAYFEFTFKNSNAP